MTSNSFDPTHFFSGAATELFKHPTPPTNLRLGQFLVNRLTELHPEIKVLLEADCYYDDGKISAFMDFLYQY